MLMEVEEGREHIGLCVCDHHRSRRLTGSTGPAVFLASVPLPSSPAKANESWGVHLRLPPSWPPAPLSTQEFHSRQEILWYAWALPLESLCSFKTNKENEQFSSWNIQTHHGNKPDTPSQNNISIIFCWHTFVSILNPFNHIDAISQLPIKTTLKPTNKLWVCINKCYFLRSCSASNNVYILSRLPTYWKDELNSL